MEQNLASYMDHTILKPETTKEEVKKLCEEAKQYGFASVCVNSYYVPFVKQQLAGSEVATCCVVGFPLGAMSTKAKAYETKVSVEDGATEVDMVINIGALKDQEYQLVKEDIEAVVAATKGNALVKVIIETCLLTQEEIKIACQLAVEAKADFVKTSTGFSTGGAKKEDVALMKETVGTKAKVKASGGIRNKETAMEMIAAGADRIGTSNAVKIVE
ncbi:MAG: deoxyribose-phosphate aldolase [Lachnospiraceae bacterium]|nr:deoxyribose-phosphate aldolase [Lachnospiraceae bacterium]MEE1341379.1 deoxyribose-phosphate aldolase [Lachnospiraceae bacterium]